MPASVSKYLLPDERHVISVHEHPAVLIGRAFWVLAGLGVAGWLTNSAHGNGTTIAVIWILWGVLLLWLVARIAEYWVHYFVVTSHRLILTDGVVVRRTNFIPLGKVSDVEFRRSAPARLLGYGELELLAPGMGDRMRRIRFIPYPEQLYLEVTGLMFPEKEDSRG